MATSIKLEKPIEHEKSLRPNAYDLGHTLFGCFNNDRDDLSSNRKGILKNKLRTKHSQSDLDITH